jgi:hypothetical protein
LLSGTAVRRTAQMCRATLARGRYARTAHTSTFLDAGARRAAAAASCACCVLGLGPSGQASGPWGLREECRKQASMVC